MNKGGIAEAVWTMLIMGGGLVLLMLLFYGITLVAPIITSTSSQITGTVTTVATNTGDGNLSTAINVPAHAVNYSLQNLSWMAYTFCIALIIAFLILCTYAQTNKWAIVIWIGIVVICAFIAMILSDSYSTLADGTMSSYYSASAFSFNDMLLRNLPTIIIGVGIIGAIIMALTSKKEDQVGVQGW